MPIDFFKQMTSMITAPYEFFTTIEHKINNIETLIETLIKQVKQLNAQKYTLSRSNKNTPIPIVKTYHKTYTHYYEDLPYLIILTNEIENVPYMHITAVDDYTLLKAMNYLEKVHCLTVTGNMQEFLPAIEKIFDVLNRTPNQHPYDVEDIIKVIKA